MLEPSFTGNTVAEPIECHFSRHQSLLGKLRVQAVEYLSVNSKTRQMLTSFAIPEKAGIQCLPE